eukprot:scaffold9479_cov108-Cylindrotheca_fusiformis.AAC.1
MKQTKIIADEGTFKGRSTTVHEDVVAMMATASKAKPKPAVKGKKSKSDEDSSEKKSPPFIKHFKAPDSEGGAKYKIRDTKEFNGEKYHFCDAPIHRFGHKWHVHAPETCRVREKWLQSQETTANVAEVPSVVQASAPASVAPSEGVPPVSSVTAALA